MHFIFSSLLLLFIIPRMSEARIVYGQWHARGGATQAAGLMLSNPSKKDQNLTVQFQGQSGAQLSSSGGLSCSVGMNNTCSGSFVLSAGQSSLNQVIAASGGLVVIMITITDKVGFVIGHVWGGCDTIEAGKANFLCEYFPINGGRPF